MNKQQEKRQRAIIEYISGRYNGMTLKIDNVEINIKSYLTNEQIEYLVKNAWDKIKSFDLRSSSFKESKVLYIDNHDKVYQYIKDIYDNFNPHLASNIKFVYPKENLIVKYFKVEGKSFRKESDVLYRDVKLVEEYIKFDKDKQYIKNISPGNLVLDKIIPVNEILIDNYIVDETISEQFYTYLQKHNVSFYLKVNINNIEKHIYHKDNQFINGDKLKIKNDFLIYEDSIVDSIMVVNPKTLQSTYSFLDSFTEPWKNNKQAIIEIFNKVNRINRNIKLQKLSVIQDEE
jgi:hypothetical protein